MTKQGVKIKVEAEARAAEYFTCVNCVCHTQGKANYRKGSKKPLCAECYEYLEKTMSIKPAEVPKEAPKRSRCVNCGGVFKTTLAVRGGAEPVCAMCRKKEPPKVPERLECPGCHFKFSIEESDKIRRFPDPPRRCTSCCCSFILVGGKLTYIKPLEENEGMTENPIHERYLIVEGRGAWACSNVYTHDFSNRESAFKFVERYRPDTCKMFRVSSTAPIMLEELSLGYDIKVTSTHEIKEHK
jgi:ribosomal protein S26